MATATVKQADIEKVVHKVLEGERAENDSTTLRAIQGISTLLTEQVIPHLPDDTGADDDIADEGNASDHEQTAEVPAQVMEAFAALYRSLSPEQAEALGAFFTAVSEELSQGDEGHEDEDPLLH